MNVIDERRQRQRQREMLFEFLQSESGFSSEYAHLRRSWYIVLSSLECSVSVLRSAEYARKICRTIRIAVKICNVSQIS